MRSPYHDGPLTLIHLSAWTGCCTNFSPRGFSELHQYEERGGATHKKRAEAEAPALFVAFLLQKTRVRS
jgi:hypothetical protein